MTSDKGQFVKALKFEVPSVEGYNHNVEFDLRPLLLRCSNIQLLALSIPPGRLLIDHGELKIKVLRLFIWGDDDNLRAYTSHDWFKSLLLISSLRRLELWGCSNLQLMLDSMALSNRSLKIRHLEITSCGWSQTDAICNFLKAFNGLETMHIDPGERCDTNQTPVMEDISLAMSEALALHSETLRLLYVTRGHSCTLRYRSHTPGDALTDVKFGNSLHWSACHYLSRISTRGDSRKVYKDYRLLSRLIQL